MYANILAAFFTVKEISDFFYKAFKEKIDFIKEQSVDYTCLTQLLDDTEKNYSDGIS